MRMSWRLAVGVLVACGGLAACAPSVQSPIAAPSSFGQIATSGSSGPVATTDQARRDVAQQLVTAWLAEVQLPPGAQARPTAPASILADSGATQVSTNLVQAFGWFVVPGTEDSVLAYAAAHPVLSFTSGGFGRGNGPGFTEEDEQFTGPQTADYGPPIIDVEATAQGSSVAVRVNVGVIWRPVRTALEQLPDTVTGATAALITSDPVRTVQLGEADARQLAAMLNGLAAELPAEHSCPASSTEETVTFNAGDHTLVFAVGNCGSVTVTADGVTQTPLAEYTSAGDSALANKLDALFGIVNSPAPFIDESTAPAVSSPVAPVGSQPAVEASVAPTPGVGTLTGRALLYGGPATPGGGQALNGAPGQGVTVKVLKNDTQIAAEVTGTDGTFTFQLPAGTYTIEGCEQTTADVTANTSTVHDLSCPVP
jgi:hypothetical protein